MSSSPVSSWVRVSQYSAICIVLSFRPFGCHGVVWCLYFFDLWLLMASFCIFFSTNIKNKAWLTLLKLWVVLAAISCEKLIKCCSIWFVAKNQRGSLLLKLTRKRTVRNIKNSASSMKDFRALNISLRLFFICLILSSFIGEQSGCLNISVSENSNSFVLYTNFSAKHNYDNIW